MKFVVSPGVSVIGPKTDVLEAGWLFTMRIWVRVMLPELLTVPLKTSGWPGCTGVNGQVLVTAMAGLFVPGQLAEAVLVKVGRASCRVGVAVWVSGEAPQEYSGTV